MIIRKTFKYRLKPNRKQRELCAQFAGSCRWIYNFALHAKKLAFEELEENLSSYDLHNLLPELKKEPETEWLGDMHSQILQQSIQDLNLAYQHFFRRVKQGEKPGFPKFKRKGMGDSFRYPQGVKIKEREVYLPKIGWTRFKKSREIEGVIKQTTVIRDTHHWYVCFSCEIEKSVDAKDLKEETVVGIDLGLSSYATLAMGESHHIEEIKNPRFFKAGLEKLRSLSKSLSKKIYKSKNWYKALQKLQVFQRKLRNCRQDFAHKLSTQLVKNHDIVGVESLSIQSLLQESVSVLARSIADASWRQFLEYLRYKIEHAGKALVEADRWFASTKTCSSCFHKQEMTLQCRTFQCQCGLKIDRDANAAINLQQMALKQYKAVGTTV